MSNTRKAAGDRKTTSAKQWKKNTAVLELPSGQFMKCKNPGLTAIAHGGLIPNSLMGVVMDAIKEGREPSPAEILSDQVDMDDMFAMMDKAVIAVAVEPAVLPVPVWDEDDWGKDLCTREQIGQIAEHKRDPEQLYIDEVDGSDKEFIFGWVTGGTTDLEQFRAERANLLATIPGQPAVADSPE